MTEHYGRQVRRQLTEAQAALGMAEARIAAVRALARGWIADGPEGEARILAERVLAALDGPADPEAMPALAALLELAEGVRADLPVGQYPDGPS